MVIKRKEDIFSEIRQKNTELKNFDKIKNDFGNFITSCSNKSCIENTNKNICDWNKGDLKSWLNLYNKTSFETGLIAREEILAVVFQAFYFAFNYKPREAQMMTVFFLLEKPENFGRIAEVLTGEGKSATIAILAAYKCLIGSYIDIITSSEVLAKRDSAYFKNFYESLNISVSNNIETEISYGPKNCYKSDIVYGTAHTFQADILRDEYDLQGTLNGRKSDTIIIDEVDSMLIDEYSKSTTLTEQFPGCEVLFFIFIIIWYELVNFQRNESVTENLKKELMSRINKILKELVNQAIPSYLNEFIENKLSIWVENAILAKNDYKINHHYLVFDSKIVPIDFKNTGVLQLNTHFSNGTQQFLQLKHNLDITPYSLITNYKSNFNFFKRYIHENENNIYGLTGTLGSIEEFKLLKKVYSVDCVKIPSCYVNNNLVRKDSVLLSQTDDWKTQIITSVQEMRNANRVILIICETIEKVNFIRDFLKLEKNINSKDIITYTRSDLKEEEVCFQNEFQKKKVIISTNLAGRGTDIKLDDTVKSNGGLHVCISFLPRNLRVENQAIGRAARQGQQGSAQMVIDLSIEKKKFNLNVRDEIISMGSLVKVRDKYESYVLNDMAKQIVHTELKDKLFEKF